MSCLADSTQEALTQTHMFMPNRIQKEKKNEKKRTSLGHSDRPETSGHNQVMHAYTIF
jgi:hypothetical protein